MSTPSYFAVIPASVRYSSVAPNAKLLYGEITALCNKEGYCWAANKYFADLYQVAPTTISEWVSALRKAGFIRLEIDPSKGNERKIHITEGLRDLADRSSGKAEEGSTPKAEAIVEENNTKRINGVSRLVLESGSPEIKRRKFKLNSQTLAAAEAIYSQYPKKVGKPVAIKAIVKAADKFGAPFLFDRTKAFAAARKGNIEFIPNPATWFNQERFNDDPATWKPGNNGKNGHNGHATTIVEEPVGWKEWLASHPEYHEICHGRKFSGCREFIQREFITDKKKVKA